MRRVLLFAEDVGHEELLNALLTRLAREEGVQLELETRNASGGHGRAVRELRDFVRDLRSRAESLPDLLVVALDANCRGHGERCKEVQDAVGPFKDWTVCAVPDPHVERWLLVDSAAFKEALGRGCSAPDQKCDRDRYKQLLRSAVRDAGWSPLLGGMEHAEAIVQAMDLERASRADASLQKLVDDFRRHLKKWRR